MLKTIIKEVIEELHGEQADSFAQEAARHFGVELGGRIDSGNFGTAYEIKDRPLVLKVSSNSLEMESAEKLIGQDPKYLVKVHEIYWPSKYKGAKLIDRINTLSNNEADLFDKFLFNLEYHYYRVAQGGKRVPLMDIYFDINYLKARKYFQKIIPEYVKYLNDIQNMAREIQTYGIQSFDINGDNLGYKNGHLVLFDF